VVYNRNTSLKRVYRALMILFRRLSEAKVIAEYTHYNSCWQF